MIISCDTSWLLSYLNEDDENHAAARSGARKLTGHDLVVCEVHLLELPAAIRAATHRGHDPIPESVARRVIDRFDQAATGKILIRKEIDMRESVAMARSLGETYAWKERHTAFDLSGSSVDIIGRNVSHVRSTTGKNCTTHGPEG